MDRQPNTDPGIRKPYPTLAVCGFLLLAVGLVFGQTVHFESVNIDDDVCVFENPRVTCGLAGLTMQSAAWTLTHHLPGNWDPPLVWISHVLDWQLYGSDAGGHHLGNVLLHAATAILLFLVLQRMTACFWPSALVAALFAVHPLRAEAVAWVTARRDVFSGLFFMLTLGAYVSYVRCHRFAIVRYLVILVIFTLGLMTKPMLVTLPCVLLLLDYWPLGRMASQRSMAVATRLVLEKLPLFIPVVVCCVVTVWSQRVSEYSYGPWSWRIGNALISYVVYLRQILWPTGLTTLYLRRGPDLPLWQVLGAGLILLSITAAVWALRRTRPYLLVGWLWYLGMLVLVVGLVPFGNQAAADRFTYLPQIGITIALVWGAADLCRSWPHRRWLCGAGSALVLAVLMGSAWRQTSYWQNSETLWTRTLDCTSDNYWAHNLLGNALALRGRTDEAVEQFQKAIQAKPDYSDAYYSLGVAAAGRGDRNAAIANYRKAIAFSGGDASAHSNLASAQNNLGYALLCRGQIDEGMVHCLEATRINPEFPEAYYNLGNALFVYGRFGEAMARYRKALELRPDYAEAHYHLGLALAARGRRDDAVAHYRKALSIKPDFTEARASLEHVLGTQGR